MFAQLIEDLNYAQRVLRKSAGFTSVAVLTLALGIGASTAIFSIVNAILLQPLPYPDADRILSLSTVWKAKSQTTARISGGDLLDIQSENQIFDALGVYAGGEIGFEIGDRGDFAGVYEINPDLPRVFSVKPDYGRLLDRRDADRSALVSLPFAQRLFGGGASALGQSISVEHQPYRIVGVLPAGFEFPPKAEVWLAAPARLWNVSRSAYNFQVVAKLKPEVSREQAQARLDTIAARLSAAYPDSNGGKGFSVAPLRERMVRPVGATLWILMAAVSMVLLISCANVANLLLARGAGRSREIAVRAALGAGRWRILRQLLAESMLLAAAAGILGVLLAAGGTGALLRLAPENLPRITEVHVDRFVLAFAAAVSMLATVVFGLLPAWHTSKTDLREALHQGGSRGLVGSRSGRLRGALVVTEVALSVVLAIGAVLLLRSLVALTTIDLGYHPEGRLVVSAHVPAHGLEEYLRVAGSFDRLLPEFAAIPGVQSAAAAMGVPTGSYGSDGSYFVEGGAALDPPHSGFLLASSGYFATMGVPLLRGREFSALDRYDAPFVAIVSQALVRRSFPNEDPIGKRIQCGLDAPDKWMTIVGVVGDVRQDSPASAPEPELYMPLSQHPYYANEFQLVLRAGVPPASLTEAVRKKMHDVYPAAATKSVTLEQMVAASIATPRFRVYLTGVFAGLALALALIGVYGVLSYLTAQRTSEFGLRLALGARPADLLAGVLWSAARLAVAGLVLGILISIASGRLIASFLFGLEPTDKLTYATVVVGILLMTLVAAAVPAWRASRIDPASAIRQE